MVPKLVPACQTPAKDGTVFVTNSENVRRAGPWSKRTFCCGIPSIAPFATRRANAAFRTIIFEYGQTQRRADIQPFNSRRRDVGDTVTLFVDRCVMCSRCVRFTREISGTSELLVTNRGAHEEIDVVPGYPLANKMSGNVVDLCPVGALGDKDFFTSSVSGSCSRTQASARAARPVARSTSKRIKTMSTGSSAGKSAGESMVDVRRGPVWLPSRPSPGTPRRPRRREKNGYVDMEWSRVPGELKTRLAGAGRLAGVFSPHLTVEEAYMLAQYLRETRPRGRAGPGPVCPSWDRMKNRQRFHDPRREMSESPRRGSRAAAFTGAPVTFPNCSISWLAARTATHPRLWVAGGYKEPWIDESHGRADCRAGRARGARHVQFAPLAAGHASVCRAVLLLSGTVPM